MGVQEEAERPRIRHQDHLRRPIIPIHSPFRAIDRGFLPLVACQLPAGERRTTVAALTTHQLDREHLMFGFLLWLVLLFLCWPLALLALVLYPLFWLITLPFRLIGIGVEGVFELLRAVVMLPARILRGSPGR